MLFRSGRQGRLRARIVDDDHVVRGLAVRRENALDAALRFAKPQENRDNDVEQGSSSSGEAQFYMIRKQVLDDAVEIQYSFQSATPFRHVAIESFLDAALAQSLLADFPRFDPSKAINEHGEVGRKAVFEHVRSEERRVGKECRL